MGSWVIARGRMWPEEPLPYGTPALLKPQQWRRFIVLPVGIISRGFVHFPHSLDRDS